MRCEDLHLTDSKKKGGGKSERQIGRRAAVHPFTAEYSCGGGSFASAHLPSKKSRKSKNINREPENALAVKHQSSGDKVTASNLAESQSGTFSATVTQNFTNVQSQRHAGASDLHKARIYCSSSAVFSVLEERNASRAMCQTVPSTTKVLQ